MDLIKTHWSKKDLDELKIYLNTLKSSNYDCEWEQRIVNTKLECFGRTSTKARELVKIIKKGNYIDFLDNIHITNHLESIICAFLISNIKDFEVFEKKLDNYVTTIDNWASCDTLRFKNKDKNKLFLLSKKYLKNSLPFVRRVGIDIFFELIKSEEYLQHAFNLFDSLKNETEYYVNMCAAWLLSYCYIYYPDKTIVYFENHKTNSFIINKGISKCRESYRISKENKQLLLKYKMTK